MGLSLSVRNPSLFTTRMTASRIGPEWIEINMRRKFFCRQAFRGGNNFGGGFGLNLRAG